MRFTHTKAGRKSSRGVVLEALENRQLMSAAAVSVPPGSTKLTGTAIGTAGSYKNQGNTIANAFDGNTASYVDGAVPTGDWVGLDLGTPRQVTRVQFFPRAAYAGRMVGGVFQVSNAADFSTGVTTLFTVTTAPAAGKFTAAAVTDVGSYEFVRYLAPVNGWGNVAELEFDGVTAPPTAAPSAPAAPVATASAGDVHLSWQADPAGLANSYTIQRQGPTDPAPVAIGTTSAGVTSFDDTAALASTVYTYTLTAANGVGASPASPPVVVTTPAPAANPWTDTDIGAVGQTGGATLNAPGSVTVRGSGADIWNQTDAFNYDYQTFVGNGSIVAQVTAQTNTNGWAKSGIMIRETANADSRFVMLALTPTNGVTFQARTATHKTPAVSVSAPGKTNVWLKLQRTGNTISGFVSADGATWKRVGTTTVSIVNNVLAGLCVSSHDTTKISTATFGNTAITSPADAASNWVDAATAPMSRWESQTFSYADKLYAFGGYVDRNLDATAECDVYDPIKNTWSVLTTVPTGGLAHAAVAVDGDTAYFAGGDLGTFSRGKTQTSTAEVLSYDLTTGVWGTVAPLPAAQSCCGMVAINNHLYLYGGLNATDTADLSDTWSLDLTSPAATWTARAPMPDARNHLGAAAIDGIAYAVGGGHLYNTTGGNDSEVDAYNPVSNQWAPVAALPLTCSSIETSTVVADGKIVVVGGQSNGGYDGTYLSNVESYDPAANVWKQIETLPEASQSSSVAYIKNTLVVADGTVDNQGGWAQNQTWIDSGILI